MKKFSQSLLIFCRMFSQRPFISLLYRINSANVTLLNRLTETLSVSAVDSPEELNGFKRTKRNSVNC